MFSTHYDLRYTDEFKHNSANKTFSLHFSPHDRAPPFINLNLLISPFYSVPVVLRQITSTRRLLLSVPLSYILKQINLSLLVTCQNPKPFKAASGASWGVLLSHQILHLERCLLYSIKCQNQMKD